MWNAKCNVVLCMNGNKPSQSKWPLLPEYLFWRCIMFQTTGDPVEVVSFELRRLCLRTGTNAEAQYRWFCIFGNFWHFSQTPGKTVRTRVQCWYTEFSGYKACGCVAKLDKASAYGAEDCRFESDRGHFFSFFVKILFYMSELQLYAHYRQADSEWETEEADFVLEFWYNL